MTTQQTPETQPGTGSGDAAGNAAAPSGAPQWIKDILADEARGKEFVQFARGTFDEDFARHKQESERRENAWKGHATNSDYWKKLDEEGRGHVGDAAANLEDAIATAIDRGVPAELLEDHTTAAGVRSFATKYMKANGSKAATAPKEQDDLETRVAAYVAKALGQSKQSERTEPSKAGDWGLELVGRRDSGRNPREAYKEVVRTGKAMPPPAEIDRMTSEWVSRQQG